MISLETARADFQKGDPVAVVGVHVGVYLEHEARHPLLRRLNRACKRRRRPGRRSDPHEAVEQLAHPKIVDRRTEEYGGQLAAQVGLPVERIVNPLHQLHVLAQLAGIAFGDAFVQLPGGEVADFDPLGVGRLPLVARKEREVALIEVINPLERRSVRDGEGKGPDTDLQLLLDLVQQIERVLARPVELVDENHHRRAAHTADIHQLARLRLDALRTVDHDNHRIDGRQRAVGVLGEIFVARRVENVDFHVAVLEAHDRSGDRNAALPLDLHEVRRGPLLYLVALDRPGDVDGSAEKQELLGKGGLARVGVRNDGERAAACDLFL